MPIYIYPYNMGSKSARLLAEALDCRRVRQNGNYHPRPNHLIINWGNPRVPGWWNRAARHNALNNPEAVRNAINKISAFRLFQGEDVPIPAWTTRLAEAQAWFVPGRNVKVLARRTVEAHGGQGIVVARDATQLPPAPLYTKYVPKQAEYRVHVVNGRVIDVQQKRRRSGEELTDDEKLIRSHEQHWVFTRQNVNAPAAVTDAAIRAVAALGLIFGGVDIGYHETYGVKVYEVNSAPGIEGTTVTNYAEAFRGFAGI